jgi:hypothetical protein
MHKLLLILVMAAPIGFLLPGASAAKGCLKGAAVGGVVGHVAGHHAVAGAAVGCVIGHHHAKVQEKAAAQPQPKPAGTGSAMPNQ